MPLLNRQHARHMLIAQTLSLLPRQQLRRLQHILDLPPIHLEPRQSIQIPLTKVMSLTSSFTRHR